MPGEAPNTLLSTSNLKILDLLCEGPIKGFVNKSSSFSGDPLMSTYYDDVPVRNTDGSYNYNVSGQGFKFGYTLGTVDQSPISGFEKIENVIPLSSNTRIANPATGAGPYKTVVASFNTDTYPDADSVNVTIRIPSLFSQDSLGNTNPYGIVYAVDISLNNGPFIQQKENINIVGKCTTPYLQTINFPLPKTTPPSSFYQWKIRVRRVDTNILSITCSNEIYVDTIAIISTTSFAYPNSVLVGTSITADQFSSVPSRSYEVDGMLVSVPNGYTPTQFSGDGTVLAAASYPNIWLGDFTTGVWTNNPAWVFYDILNNHEHGLGDYLPPNSVDKWTLYQIAQYCDQLTDDGYGGLEPNFTCNVVISQPTEAYNVLLSLASVFRGMVYYANGTIHSSQTSNKSPVYAFTNANVSEGGFSYSDTAKNTRSTVALVKWVDPNNGYRENVEYVEDTEGILRYGYVEKQMSAFACTSQGQAHRFGAWTLLTERLLTETITFQTSLEGNYLRPGDCFTVYDNFRNNRSQGGRIVGFNAAKDTITLDRSVQIEAGSTYLLSAVVPKYTLDGTGDVTGSNQIEFIRNSQIETLVVSTPTVASTGILTVVGSFSSGLFVGTPWVLTTTGGSILTQSKLYTCLATSEAEPGKIEVLGLEANTGINFAISTGYTVNNYPDNPGDLTSIFPPSNLTINTVTGLLNNNLFYSNFELDWTASPSTNLAYYVVSGKYPGFPYSGYQTTSTTFSFSNFLTGTYNFKVAAVSKGGVYSTFITNNATVNTGNPMGPTPALSGVVISNGFDPLYFDSGSNKYTGYIGLSPTFHWDIPVDNALRQIPAAQFVTGYRIRIKDLANTTDYINPVYINGRNNLYYKIPYGLFYSGMLGGPQRAFNFFVETMDTYGNILPGANLKVNNPAPRPILRSGFAGFNGGFDYDILMQPESDVSGVYFWHNTGSGFQPTTGNYNQFSEGLAGFVFTPYTTPYYSWFAPVDTFGLTGCRIYGPIRTDPNSIISGFQLQINSDVSGAFSLLTGMITSSSIIFSGQNSAMVTTVNGLSGQITGLPGDVNTSLNVRVNTIVVSSSGALSQNISAVQANLQTTGSTLTSRVANDEIALTNSGVALGLRIDNVSANLTTTGQTLSSNIITVQNAVVSSSGALASSISQVSVSLTTTGQTLNASINSETSARISADTGIFARWGVNIDNNGRIVGRINLDGTNASSTFLVQADKMQFQTPGYNPVTLVDVRAAGIAFGANIQSDNFVSGSAGWQMTRDGNLEASSGVFRNGIFSTSVATPTFSPPSTGFSSSLSVTINNNAAGSTLRYTLDGTEVTSSSTTYSAPLSLTTNTTIRAKSYSTFGVPSNEAIGVYALSSSASSAAVGTASAFNVAVFNPPTAKTTVVSLSKAISGPALITVSFTATNIGPTNPASTTAYLYRGATLLTSQNLLNIPNGGGSDTITFNYTDSPGAGTYTYTMQCDGDTGGTPNQNDFNGTSQITIVG